MLRKGDIVVIDNLSVHKRRGIREAIEAVGASQEYLPPYSPDLNPIELLYSKTKWRLRKAAKRAIDELWQLLEQIPGQIKKQECQNNYQPCRIQCENKIEECSGFPPARE